MQDQTATNPPSDGSGLETAAAAFEALLTGPTDNEKPEEAPQRDAEADTDGEAEALTASEDSETQGETEAEGASEEPAEDEAAADGEGEPDEAQTGEAETYTVKVNGEDVTVTLDELKNGYSRTADYHRKTQALAEEKRAALAEKQALQQEREAYAALLPALQERLQALTEKEPDWQKLYNEDPLEYVRQKDAWRERQDQIRAAQAEQARLAQIAQAETAQQIKQRLEQERALMLEAVPEWKEPKRFSSDAAAIRDYGKRLGSSDAELGAATDHRAILALYKAMQYDRLMNQKNKPAPKASAAPAPVKPGSQSRIPRPVSELTKAKQRLAQTGRVEDAKAIFEQMLNRK